MADIREKILKQYGIDIDKKDEGDVLSLYKIKDPDISDADLEKAISDTRARWLRSINGTMEANKKRDQERLNRADVYEKILRDKALRKAIFEYKNGGGSPQAGGEALDFARDYFRLIHTSKKISHDDVDFFCKYYGVSGRSKGAVKKMVEDEFGDLTGKETYESDEKDKGDKEEDAKNGRKGRERIENLFKTDTLLKIKEACNFYEKGRADSRVQSGWPDAGMSFYNCLAQRPQSIVAGKDRADLIKCRVGECHKGIENAQKKGMDGVDDGLRALRDAFNIMSELLEKSDVKNNIDEFMLLVKYPNLTPYMSSIVKMKKDTFSGVVDVARKNYRFFDEKDFILNYYLLVCDNFGITNDPIDSILRKAQKGAKTNKVLRFLDKLRGNQDRRRLSFGAEIIYWLLYWPLYFVYLLFELFRVVFAHLSKAAIPLGVIVLVLYNMAIPKISDFGNLGNLIKLFKHGEWVAYLSEVWREPVSGGLSTFMASVIAIVGMLLLFALPAVMFSVFTMRMAELLKKSYDWIGYKRTLENIIDNVRENTEQVYFNDRKKFVKKRLPGVLVNVLCMALIAAAIIMLAVV